jgi:hypothetical protein
MHRQRVQKRDTQEHSRDAKEHTLKCKDLEGEYEPVALMGIDAFFQLTAIEIIEWFVVRWNQKE